MKTILLFGSTGWIGSQLIEPLVKAGYSVINANSRLDQYSDLEKEVLAIRPNIIVNAAGLTGRPNIDWCESHKIETMDVNTVGTSVLASVGHKVGAYFVQLATGCIYEYNDTHPVGGPGYKEDETPNFMGSYYSYSKYLTEQIVMQYPNTLLLRLRMPLSDDLNPRSVLSKLLGYKKIADIPNSMSILHDLLPVIPKMIKEKATGIYNFCNPGAISHNELLELYRLYIDPNHRYENMTLSERDKLLAAKRSDVELDCSKLAERYNVPHIKDSIRSVFERMQKGMGI